MSYLMGADEPMHAVDVTDSLVAGVASLRACRDGWVLRSSVRCYAARTLRA
jgi:hypothetical protein